MNTQFGDCLAAQYLTRMNAIKLARLFAVALVALAMPAIAQFYPPIVLDPSLTKFFDPDSAFSASVEIIHTSPDVTSNTKK